MQTLGVVAADGRVVVEMRARSSDRGTTILTTDERHEQVPKIHRAPTAAVRVPFGNELLQVPIPSGQRVLVALVLSRDVRGIGNLEGTASPYPGVLVIT